MKLKTQQINEQKFGCLKRPINLINPQQEWQKIKERRHNTI